MTQFADLDSANGMNKLNGFLATRSYIEGYQFSTADVAVFEQFSAAPESGKHPNAYRWFVHIAALTGRRAQYAVASAAAAPAPAAAAAAPAKKAGKKGKKSPKKSSPKKNKKKPAPVDDDDDDDDDLFGDDDDEDEAELAAAAEARRKKAQEAKEAKKKAAKVDRSQCVFEIKPWEAETDLNALAGLIKATEINGLNWGEAHKLVPVAFGIKKLIMSCVIVDDLVLIEDITDKIEEFEDYVQSVDLATMNRL